MKTVKYWLPAFLWAGVIFWFSSLAPRAVSQVFWQEFLVKKSIHVIEYFVLFALVYRALASTTNLGSRSLFIAFFLTALYGVSDEYHQSFIPGREARIRDVVFDGIGAFLAWFVIWKCLPKAPKKLTNWAKSLQIV